MSRDAHLFGPGPKRILALDGGGVRGIISLAFLERIEALLAARAGREARRGGGPAAPTFRLGDYFDLIGGTSTGSLIATGLALGFSVGQLIEMSVKRGRSTRKDLQVGICGEQGGDPATVKFCHRSGMDYVSCSPFRLPVARLAAAQAAIEERSALELEK